jgi:hypothetical protein
MKKHRACGAAPSTLMGQVSSMWEFMLAGSCFGLLILLLVVFLVAQARVGRAGEFKGPALSGTARLLSAKRAGGLAAFGKTYKWEIVCRIGLRVEIPGRPQYDVAVTAPVANGWFYGVRTGGTYAVQVDSANPHTVRFDYRRSITPPPARAVR